MIVCCGEALIDMLPRTLQTGESAYLPVAGGAIFNTAIALGRLGKPVGFLSSLSTDMFGAQLRETLAESNVDTSLCVPLDYPTTLAFVKLTDGHAQYSFFDENSALRNIRIDDLPAVDSSVDALHFGAISLIPEPAGSAYEHLMAENRHLLLSLDPNIRPGFVRDEHAYRERLKRMIAIADIVKVSDEDLNWIAEGGDGNTLIARWLAGNTGVVLLTKGKDGVSVHRSSGSFDLPAKKITVVDTVGAGDAFNAGFLARLNDLQLSNKSAFAAAGDDQLREAATFAMRVAGLTCIRAGANSPWAHELDSNGE